MGHENVGEVIAVGPDAKGVKVGDVRLVHPWMGCGECKVCRRGDENLCLKPRNLGVFAQRRLCHPPDGAASAPPVRHRPAVAGEGGAARLLGRHGLSRAEEGWRDRVARGADRDHRRRRRRPDGRDAGARRWAPRASSWSTSTPASARPPRRPVRPRRSTARRPTRSKQIQAAAGGGVWAVIDFVGSSATGEARQRRARQGRHG